LTEEYENAKTLIGDIVTSFNKQVEKQEEKLGAVTQKAIIFSSKSSNIESRLETQENQMTQMSTKIDEIKDLKEKTSAQFDTVNQKVEEITRSHEELHKKIISLEEKTKILATPEANIEAAIPIKQEKALASLTPTELLVLEILVNEGDKTAPEIKARVNLTREHTARLMKKLYEEGYLERTTGKIPFAYRIKEEMRKILKKPEAKT
jgi:chromosome segregation ATPase